MTIQKGIIISCNVHHKKRGLQAGVTSKYVYCNIGRVGLYYGEYGI
jgi:hypothetical protein